MVTETVTKVSILNTELNAFLPPKIIIFHKTQIKIQIEL